MREPNKIFVKPEPGRRVRHPDGSFRILLDVGELVSDVSYWRRRLQDADVVETQPPTEQPAINQSETKLPETKQPAAQELKAEEYNP